MSLQNAVNRFPVGDNFPFITYRNNIAQSHTGNTTEKTLVSQLISPDAYGNNAIFETYTLFSITNNANSKIFRIKFNGVTIAEQSAANRAQLQIYKFLFNRNSKALQVGTQIYDQGVSGSSTVANNFYSIDLSQGLTFSVTGQLGVASDSLALEGCFLRITY